MIHVFHTPTGWKVCQNYPGPLHYDWEETEYQEAVSLSIANAVDVREEDWDYLKNKVNWVSQGIAFDDWEPDDNYVYALAELEVEIKEVWVYDQIYRKLAHVFRKKEEPKIEESQEELWLEIESIIDKWWDDKNDLRSSAKMVEQDLASKFHLTRVKAELKGEKK